MRENALRRAWASGRKTVNGWLSIPSPFAAEVMAHQPWDSLTVDMQHGVIDYQAMLGMLQAISTRPAVVPMARVPWLEPGIVMKTLDAGAYGIICPMINTPEEAALFVSCCRYAPQGQRSFGPIRASMYAGPDYGQRANEEILAIAMIETRQAVDRLDAILATPGLDGVYVGPSDLALSLGHQPALDPEIPEVVDAITTIVRATKAKGLCAGIHCMAPAYVRRMFDFGFDFASIASESRLMALKAQEVIEAATGRGGGEAPSVGAAPASSRTY
jgi:4-hydroxy-2-oxoheptanedioate aldolase